MRPMTCLLHVAPSTSFSSDPGLEVVLSLIPSNLVTNTWAPFALGPLRRLQDLGDDSDSTLTSLLDALASLGKQPRQDASGGADLISLWASSTLAPTAEHLQQDTGDEGSFEGVSTMWESGFRQAKARRLTDGETFDIAD